MLGIGVYFSRRSSSCPCLTFRLSVLCCCLMLLTVWLLSLLLCPCLYSPSIEACTHCNIFIAVRSGAELRCAPVSSAIMGGRKRPVGPIPVAEKWKCWHAVPEHLQYLLPHPGTSWLERGPVGCHQQCEGLWRCSPCPRRPRATWQHLIEADHLVNVLAWLQEPETVARLQAMQGAMHGPRLSFATTSNPVSYTHLTLPTNREV